MLKVASDHMTAKGAEMEKYTLSGLSYDYIDRRWVVLFDGKSLNPGDHFVVRIRDQDPRDLEVVPGL